MRIILLSDIHGNLPALQAVLNEVLPTEPDLILSLGDQINLGPSGREVMDLLLAHHIICLRGNHERYILEALEGDRKYQAANFASIRYNAGRFTMKELELPMTYRLGNVLFCHAMPEDDRFPVPYPSQALPKLTSMNSLPARHIVCGHGHDPRHYVIDGCTVDVVGSLGCMDHGMPGWACYAELLLQDGCFCLTNRFAAYDIGLLRPLFLSSGYAEYCPIMSRLTCLQMEQNHEYMVSFVNRALALSAQRHETQISAQTWADTDAAFPWKESISAADFWRREAQKQGMTAFPDGRKNVFERE